MNFLSKMTIGTKIQLAIGVNVILAILIGEFVISRGLELTGTTGILINLVINSSIAFIYGYFVSRAITRPLKNAAGALQKLAKEEGDLSTRLTINSNDEVGQLSKSFNLFIGKLHGIISQVVGSTERVVAAANRMAEITEQTTGRVSEQQTETDQVATAMNEMVATVQEVSRTAEEASEATNSADKEARTGTEASNIAMTGINTLVDKIEETEAVIKKLEVESENIGTVLDVIRGIAEQTNLLALNASIEAARAGDQGRGFAVVADEVRTLASRTRESTDEINTMIMRLQSEVHDVVESMGIASEQGRDGAEKVEKAIHSLNSIASIVSTIFDMNTLIASASVEQTGTAEEINKNIANISHISQQTSEDASSTRLTSEELTQLSISLQQLVGQFKL
jgi:methyl-accepting chemotaxis protein